MGHVIRGGLARLPDRRTTTIPDESAARAIHQSSHEEQFGELLLEFRGGLARLAASYESVPQSQQDLLQDIYIALWLALPKFRTQSSVRTFVYRIAHNRALTHVWRRKRLAPSESIEDIVLMDTKPGPECAAIAVADRNHLFQAIRELPIGLRQVILLALEEFSNGEIAAVLGISENNAAVRLTRARAMLRDRMRRK